MFRIRFQRAGREILNNAGKVTATSLWISTGYSFNSIVFNFFYLQKAIVWFINYFSLINQYNSAHIETTKACLLTLHFLQEKSIDIKRTHSCQSWYLSNSIWIDMCMMSRKNEQAFRWQALSDEEVLNNLRRKWWADCAKPTFLIARIPEVLCSIPFVRVFYGATHLWLTNPIR